MFIFVFNNYSILYEKKYYVNCFFNLRTLLFFNNLTSIVIKIFIYINKVNLVLKK